MPELNLTPKAGQLFLRSVMGRFNLSRETLANYMCLGICEVDEVLAGQASLLRIYAKRLADRVNTPLPILIVDSIEVPPIEDIEARKVYTQVSRLVHLVYPGYGL